MSPIPSFSEEQLEAICGILGDTEHGLTGSEIGRMLSRLGIDDPFPGMTKRYRLYQALSDRQKQDACANNVVAFIHAAMDPVRFVGKDARHNDLRDRLNQVLAFAGYRMGEDGKLSVVSAVKTLAEAEQRAGKLRVELQRRGVHPDVIRFCRAELLQDNYFHAVLEATKSVAEKIRRKTGLISDGAELVDQAFGMKSGPKLAFNTLRSESEKSEHRGMMNLLKGIFGMFRNPAAHSPKISWTINEQDAIDLMTVLSLIHRRLDQAVPTGK
jgi:uncharacterized protein (TIGR02391 family)